MRKIFYTILCLLIITFSFNVLAANTYSIDLELSSSQSLSVADADTTTLDGMTNLSAEMWIKLEQLPSTAASNISLIGKYNSSDNNRAWSVQFDTSDKLQVTISDNGLAADADLTQFSSDAAFVVAGNVGSWVHVAITYTGATIKMYKNGSEINASVNGSRNGASSVYAGTATFRIGASFNTASQFFDGLIDDVRVWNDVRTLSEISNNKDTELVGNEAGLVGYWKLNNSLLDETSNDNDLTNNNSAVFSSSVPFTGAERRIILIQ